DSEPALAAEVPDLERGRAEDPAPRPPVAPYPLQLRDVAEVLAVEADDEGGDEQDRGDRCEPLHDLVLVVRDLRLVVVADAPEQVAREFEAVEGAQQLVVGVRDVQLDLAREELAGARVELDPVVDD